MSHSYRLELLPTQHGAPYYTSKTFSENENAGVDLYIAQSANLNKLLTQSEPTLLDLGTSARMIRVNADGSEEEVHYWLCPRSSIYKTGLMMANSQGVIDRSYRGTLKAPVWVVSRQAFVQLCDDTDLVGMRLFQIVAPDMGWIREVRVVQELPVTSRGEGGFGSTGR